MDKYDLLFNSLDEGFHISELIYDDGGIPIDWRYLEVNKSFEQQTGILDAPGRLGSEIAPGTERYWFYEALVFGLCLAGRRRRKPSVCGIVFRYHGAEGPAAATGILDAVE